MSKGNMLLGYARGKMGDIVFARVNGQQIQRPRNRQPKNPRTAQQMYQRSLFACAVSFFSKGRQALFQYAFESKKTSESDYNAFVRLNAKNGIHMTKNQLDNLSYPKIGNWIMTQGSLPGLSSTFDDESKIFKCEFVAIDAELDAITLGMLSRAMIATGNYMLGDIITIVNIRSNAFYEEGSDPDPIVSDSADTIPWIIEQFSLDPNSNEPINGLLNNFVFAKGEENMLVLQSRALSSSVDEIGGFCVVHSRRTSSGLKVSTTQITNSVGVQKALAKCATTEYIEWVLVDWQSRGDAVLEGSISANGQSMTEVVNVVGAFESVSKDSVLLPYSLSSIDYGKKFVLTDGNDAALYANSIDDVQAIAGQGITGYAKAEHVGTLSFEGGATATIEISTEGYVTLSAQSGITIPELVVIKKK